MSVPGAKASSIDDAIRTAGSAPRAFCRPQQVRDPLFRIVDWPVELGTRRQKVDRGADVAGATSLMNAVVDIAGIAHPVAERTARSAAAHHPQPFGKHRALAWRDMGELALRRPGRAGPEQGVHARVVVVAR